MGTSSYRMRTEESQSAAFHSKKVDSRFQSTGGTRTVNVKQSWLPLVQSVNFSKAELMTNWLGQALTETLDM